MRRAGLTFLLLIAVVVPLSAAHAQSPLAPSPSASAAPGASPAAPVAGAPLQTQLTLLIARVGGARATTLTGSRVVVRGVTGAFVPGQTFAVRFYVGGRQVAVRRVTLQPRTGGRGAFALFYRPRRPGPLVVLATHDPTAELGGLSARTRTVDVIPRRVRPRSGRASIYALQRRLRALGYVTGEPGSYDARTARAVLAFRKVTGMARTANASIDVMRAIARGAGRFVIARPDHGRHIEADLSRQVIALIDRGRVQAIYPVSSGAPSTPTVIGSFRVYSKTFGTNAKGMVHSSYFIRGYALHGYWSVPAFPASHGCLRLPIAEAVPIYRWATIGTPVDVYP